MRKRCLAFCSVVAVVATLALVRADQQQTSATGARAATVRQAEHAVPQTASAQHAVMTRYCVGCHNAKLKTGGLAL